MRIEEFSAKNVSDATKEGLAKMGITEDRAIIEVIDQGGFLKKAKVRITDKGSEGDKAVAFINGLAKVMNVACTVELEETDDVANIEIISVNSGAIIGHRGDVLDAIQYLASIVANENKDDFKRVVVDCENYRERRVGILEALAQKMADKAYASARPVKLEPMNAFERRIIHAYLTKDERVSTASYGEEPYRYLSIRPSNMKPRISRDGKRPFNKDGGFKGKGGFDKRDGNRDRRPGGDRRDRNDRNDRPRKPKTDISAGFASYGYLGKADNSSENKD